MVYFYESNFSSILFELTILQYKVHLASIDLLKGHAESLFSRGKTNDYLLDIR